MSPLKIAVLINNDLPRPEWGTLMLDQDTTDIAKAVDICDSNEVQLDALPPYILRNGLSFMYCAYSTVDCLDNPQRIKLGFALLLATKIFHEQPELKPTLQINLPTVVEELERQGWNKTTLEAECKIRKEGASNLFTISPPNLT